MSYISVEVDVSEVLDNLDNDNLISELRERLNRKKIHKNDMDIIKALVSNNEYIPPNDKVLSLNDQMKMDEILPNLWKVPYEKVRELFNPL